MFVIDKLGSLTVNRHTGTYSESASCREWTGTNSFASTVCWEVSPWCKIRSATYNQQSKVQFTHSHAI